MMKIKIVNLCSTSKKRLTLTLFFLLSLTNNAYPLDSDTPDIKQITAVVVKNFPPHYSTDIYGKPIGFAIDTMNAIADIAGLKVEYIVKDNWTQVASALKSGEADLIPNLGLTKQRLIDFDFTKTVELSPISIIVSEGSDPIEDENDLKGKIIGVVEFNVGKKIASQLALSYIIFPQPENALIGLLSGQVDAIIYPKSVMQKISRESRLEHRINISEKPLTTLERGIAVHKGNTALVSLLNPAIDKFYKSTPFENIYIKWYGKELPFWTKTRIIITAGIIIFVIIILSGLTRYLSLKNINRQLVETIKDRQQTELKLSDRKTHLRTLIEVIPDLVWLKDPDGVYISCNHKFELLYGEKEENIIGKTDYDFVDKVLADFFRKKDCQAIEAGGPSLNEEEVTYASDGHKEILETIKTPMFDSSGKLVGVLGIARDITERKKFERELTQKETEQREILNSMVDAVITIDETGNILTFNRAAKLLFGYDYNEVIGQNVKLLMPEKYSKKHDQYIKNFILYNNAQIIGIGREVEGLRKNNEVFPMRISIAELPSDKNGSRRFIGSCSDITLFKQQEQRLRRSQKMESLGKLTGGIAHDFNNILGIIIGYSELLTHKMSEHPDCKRYIDEIRLAGERGSKLTSKLLAFSRQQSPNTSVVDINDVLNQEHTILEKTLTSRIKLIFDFDSKLWPVLLDRSDLQDAILNMIINSSHAIESNGQVTIQTQNATIDESQSSELQITPGDYVILKISDTGCGIDKDSHEKVFEPFYTTKIERGTGLGLSQVYGFVKRSGGSIKLSSEPGQATTLNLYFPRHTEETSSLETQLKNELDIYRDVSGNESILIVDDEAALLEVTAEIFKQHGYNILTAQNGMEALDILKKESVNIVLSDVIMPEMDGYELAENIHRQYPDIKIQLASGFNDNRHLNTDNKEWHKNLLRKPYDSQTLLNRIRELLA